MRINRRPFIINLLRIVLAVVFIFSGFVKAVDPWGTAIKLGEYFHAFGMNWLIGSQMILSIILSATELLLGLLFLFNIKVKTVSFLTALFMLGFTTLTLIIAITNPVEDCGCFGDAIKLTNWQTFIKNAVLLPFSFIIFIYFLREKRYKKNGRERIFTIMLLCVSIYPSLNSYKHLPKIDFLPFKVGTNIQQGLSIPDGSPGGEYRTILTYRNLQTGELHDFLLEDTVWYDTTTWEFVDSRSDEIIKGYVPSIGDFSIFSGSNDITFDILNEEKEIFLLIINDPQQLVENETMQLIRQISDYAYLTGGRLVSVTSAVTDYTVFNRFGIHAEVYNMDATTLKMLLRAENGLVIINKGTIVAKWNIRDVPDFTGSASATDYVIKEKRKTDQRDFIILMAFSVFLLLIIYGIRCKRD